MEYFEDKVGNDDNERIIPGAERLQIIKHFSETNYQNNCIQIVSGCTRAASVEAIKMFTNIKSVE